MGALPARIATGSAEVAGGGHDDADFDEMSWKVTELYGTLAKKVFVDREGRLTGHHRSGKVRVSARSADSGEVKAFAVTGRVSPVSAAAEANGLCEFEMRSVLSALPRRPTRVPAEATDDGATVRCEGAGVRRRCPGHRISGHAPPPE